MKTGYYWVFVRDDSEPQVAFYGGTDEGSYPWAIVACDEWFHSDEVTVLSPEPLVPPPSRKVQDPS